MLHGGLNQMIFLAVTFVVSSIYISLVLELCMNPDLSKASWYGVTETLKISSEEDNNESRDSIDSGSCLMIDGGWLDSRFMYLI